MGNGENVEGASGLSDAPSVFVSARFLRRFRVWLFDFASLTPCGAAFGCLSPFGRLSSRLLPSRACFLFYQMGGGLVG